MEKALQKIISFWQVVNLMLTLLFVGKFLAKERKKNVASW